MSPSCTVSATVAESEPKLLTPGAGAETNGSKSYSPN
jgi:hypothetical protein